MAGPGPQPTTGGTTTVVSSGSLTSTALVTGGGTTTLQTPSATSTLDSSGNLAHPGTLRMTANGALSTGAGPALRANGTWITGGSATTTKPYALIETTGATSAGWNTAGTGLGVNSATGFTGNLEDLQVNGSSKWKVDATDGPIVGTGLLQFNSSNPVIAHLSATNGSTSVNGGTSVTAGGRLLLYGSTHATLANQARVGTDTGPPPVFTLGLTPSTIIGTAPAQGQGISILQCMELLTIAAAATSTTTMQVPAGAILLSVSVRVTVVIPTAATFTVVCNGITFNTAAVSTAATSTDAGTNANVATVATYPYIGTAAGVVITPNLTPADNTGRVRITCTYLVVTPPTS